MTSRRARLLLGLSGILPVLLAGCPDGAGFGVPGQDDVDGSRGEAGEVDGAITPVPDTGTNPRPDGGGPPRGSGALCGANGVDDCGQFLVCAESLGCVECTSGADCAVTAPRCLQGKCVPCRTGTGSIDGGVPDCPGAERACWTSDLECHAACSDAVTCPGGTTCDKPSGECVGCVTDANCPSGVCSPTLRKCVGCIADATCPSARPRCRVLTGTCEACTANIDCGLAAPICDPVTFTCRTGCSSDAYCPGEKCDLAKGKCVPLPVDAGPVDAGGG